jgi:hypothetical protein
MHVKKDFHPISKAHTSILGYKSCTCTSGKNQISFWFVFKSQGCVKSNTSSL